MAVIKVTQNIQRSASIQVVKKASKQGRFKVMKIVWNIKMPKHSQVFKLFTLFL